MNQLDTAANTDKSHRPKSSRAIWITLAVLILLAGLGYYLWRSTQEIYTQQQNQITQLQAGLTKLEISSRDQQQQLADTNKHAQVLQDMAQQALDTANRKQKGWLLAEADYLMRIASHRLQISHDINGAIAALQGADQGLFETGDVTLYPVRQQLAKDVAALKALHQADIDGIVLALDQMSDQVANLPFKLADEEVKQQLAATSSTEDSRSFGSKILDAIMSLGSIKIHSGRAEHASTEQLQYQSMHILLSHLSSARLAALRFDSHQFAYDIGIAKQLLNKYYDLQDNRVKQILKDLDKYAVLELSPALPDISASWTRLQVARNKMGEAQR